MIITYCFHISCNSDFVGANTFAAAKVHKKNDICKYLLIFLLSVSKSVVTF